MSDRNDRRSDEAERARHIASTESVAFATMLLGLLNDADTVLHRLEHEVQPVLDRAVPPQQHAMKAAPAPADHGPVHQDQHAGTIETPADSSPKIHADATPATQPRTTEAVHDATPSGEATAAHDLASTPIPSNPDVSPAHVSSQSTTTSHDGAIASPTLDLGATVHNLVDGVTGIVDTALTAVSSTISSLNTTVGQLTSTVTGTVSHLLDGVTGTVTGLLHDTPTTGVLEPLTDLASLSSSAGTTDLSGAAHYDGSLFDTAGAIPTSLLHPIPLQLGFLGQPTVDGHEPHDGAFSTLGGHHF